MRFDDDNVSNNIGSQRGSGGSFGGGGGGLGGGMGLIMGMVASRFGIGGILVLLVIMFFFGGLGGLTGGGQQAVSPGRTGGGAQSAAEICRSDPTTQFACNVYTSSERYWASIFEASGQRFDPPQLVFYDRRGRSGCGAADSAMGPFYCPADQGIYLDTSFFQELAQRFRAPGDFAQAYVVAHEMGHHIQTITGTNDQVRRAQQATSEAQSNALQVRMELQADCYAGVWAAGVRQNLEPGDLEEGMRAAGAIGDDTLQEAAGRRQVPESFTHGTAAQRQQALRRGFEGGNGTAAQREQALRRGFEGGNPQVCASYMQGV